MTLIELLATIAIIGMLLVTAIPPFRSLQARESMTLTQQGVSALLIRMQQLSLAPPEAAADERIIGYGLAFHKRDVQNTLTSCTVVADNDFFALYKFVVSRDPTSIGRIVPVLNPFPSTAPCGTSPTIDAKNYRSDFFILPDSIQMNAALSTKSSQPQTNFPWLISVALQSAGTSYGQIDPSAYRYNNPLPENNPSASGVLVIEHTRIKVGNAPLCRSIQFSRSSSGIAASARQFGGC
jgi:hypothetical protein